MSSWYLKKMLVLLLLQPVGWTVAAMPSILHVLHKLCGAKCLEKPCPLMDSQKDAPRNLFLHLLGLVCMILEGPSIKDQKADNPSSTCGYSNIEVQQHQAQADTCHIISQRQAQHCTRDTSSNIHRDDVACPHMQEGTNREAVTPGY